MGRISDTYTSSGESCLPSPRFWLPGFPASCSVLLVTRVKPLLRDGREVAIGTNHRQYHLLCSLTKVGWSDKGSRDPVDLFLGRKEGQRRITRRRSFTCNNEPVDRLAWWADVNFQTMDWGGHYLGSRYFAVLRTEDLVLGQRSVQVIDSLCA